MGANGSGKSTLVKVLAGYHAPAAGGELRVAGRPAPLPLRPDQARALGLRFVHQELALIPALSVLENLRLDELAVARGARIVWARERRRAQATLARFGLDRDPRTPVADLSAVERTLLALARAAAESPTGLVLDEPTTRLPAAERERLLGVIRGIASAGAGVLFVSHDLAELRALADRVTVLRNGRNAGTVAAEAAEERDLARMMLGRAPPLPAPAAEPAADRAIAIAGVSAGAVRDLSLRLNAGEVVGLTGPPGSGVEELPYLLVGARPCTAGRLTLGGAEHDLTAMTPERALRAGVALLPGERESDAAAASLPVEDNVMLPVLERFTGRLALDRRRLRGAAATLLREHGVTPAEPRARFATLSGGNQQRALLAKWLQLAPPLLLLDEPMRGVDVGARREIAARIAALAARGSAVLCVSGDRDQLALLCDRVLICSDGGCWRSA